MSRAHSTCITDLVEEKVLTAEREFESDVHVGYVGDHDAGRVDQVDQRVVAHADRGHHGARHARLVAHRTGLSCSEWT